MSPLLNARPRLLAPPPPRIVYRWDLDKTYLKSEFDSLRDMVKIPFEKAEDKIAAPGVTALIRALRDTALRQGREVGVYFISASPPQIGRAIRQKLELDGIVYDGIVFKDQLQRLMRGKFRHLREHVGYKLTELLKARRAEPAGAREYLFGDDWESDPLVYSLYADVVAGRVAPGELATILESLRVDRPLAAYALDLAGEVAAGDAVARIFINLERRTPPARFQGYGARLVPTFNYLQTAVCLHEERALDDDGLAGVVRSLIGESGYTVERVVNSIADLERRASVGREAAAAARDALRAAGILPAPVRSRRERWGALWRRAVGRLLRRRPAAEAGPLAIDYRAMIAGEPPAGIEAGMSEELVVLVTAGSREAAETMAETLVGERLAACVNVVGPVRSIYRWRGEVCRDDEHLMIVKTTRSRYAELERRIGELHTYEVPEIIALPIERGAAAYLAWLRGETEPDQN